MAGSGIRTREAPALEEPAGRPPLDLGTSEGTAEEVDEVQVLKADESFCSADTRCNGRKPAASFRRVEHGFLAREPATITCPNCLTCVTTVVERLSQPITHWTALGLTAVCLCFLPYFSHVLRDTIHYCPCCSIYLGIKFASVHDAKESCIACAHLLFDQQPES